MEPNKGDIEFGGVAEEAAEKPHLPNAGISCKPRASSPTVPAMHIYPSLSSPVRLPFQLTLHYEAKTRIFLTALLWSIIVMESTPFTPHLRHVCLPLPLICYHKRDDNSVSSN
jgi:hypothetical protein